MSDARAPRRRRSVASTPAFVDPADVPEDAAGRISLIVVRAPDDFVESIDADDLPPPPPPPPPPEPSPPPSGLAHAVITAQGGWLAVAVLAAVLLAVFIIGMVLTR